MKQQQEAFDRQYEVTKLLLERVQAANVGVETLRQGKGRPAFELTE